MSVLVGVVVVTRSLALVTARSVCAISVTVGSAAVPVSGSSVGVSAKVATLTTPCVWTEAVFVGLSGSLIVTWNLTFTALPVGSVPMITSTGATKAAAAVAALRSARPVALRLRSEERRVGKE